jgi:tetratricopeptide (TPR) repeat protein
MAIAPFFRTVALVGLSAVLAHAQAPAPSAVPSSPQPQLTPKAAAMFQGLMTEAVEFMKAQNWTGARERLDVALTLNPQSVTALAMRATTFIKQQNWAAARADFQAALQLQPNNPRLHFNLAELEFKQGNYEAARARFVPLVRDASIGDIAAFKAFLCDLCSKKEELASRELTGFEKRNGTPSYYYANASWYLFHHQAEEARKWLGSAETLFSPDVTRAYLASLHDLGYYPLPDPPAAAKPAAK